MTLFELTEAMGRHRKFLFGGLAVLLVVVFFTMFSFSGGSPQIRGTTKYEAEVQIAVLAPDTDLLTDSESPDGLMQAAAVYADLLSSAEAAVGVMTMTGYEMDEAMRATVSRDAPLIINKVIGPSFELATQAAVNSFAWLGQKLQEPLETISTPTTTTLPPRIVLSQPFDTFLTVRVAEGLGDLGTELFVTIATDSGEQLTVPIVQTAGSSVTSAAQLSPVTTVELSVQTADGEVDDVVRVAPLPPDRVVDAYPILALTLGDGSLDRTEGEDDVVVWEIDADNVTAAWTEGVIEPADELEPSAQVEIALVTTAPEAVQIGGRRGPLLAIAVLFVGLIALLTAVIVAETWRRERIASNPEVVVVEPVPADDVTPPPPKPRPTRRRTRQKAVPAESGDGAEAPEIAKVKSGE